MNEQNNNRDKNDNDNQEKKKENKLKEKIKRKVITSTIKILMPFIIIILVAAFFLKIIEVGLDIAKDALISMGKSIADVFTIDAEGAIEVNNEILDTVINGISEMGIDMDGLKLMGDVDYSNPDIQAANQEALRKYLRKFYEAEAMTQTINKNPDLVEKLNNEGKAYGTVYVHRADGEDEVNPTNENALRYISYEEMKNMEKAGNKDITKYFSIDESGNLVYAGWTNTVIKKDGQVISNKTSINLETVDYKSSISQYTAPMNFFLSLTLISQNPEFVSAVVDLVKQSDIRITIMDTESTTTEKETYTYTKNVKTTTKVTTITFDDWDVDHQYPIFGSRLETKYEEVPVTEITETIITSVNPTAKVTSVKTWFCEQSITYNKKEEKSNPNPNTVNEGSEEEPELTEPGSVTWKTDKKRKCESSTTTTKYEEGTSGDVKYDRLGEKGSQGVNSSGKVDENTTFLGLLDDKFTIPNTGRKDSAANNILSGKELLFYLLQKDESTQNVEQIMRYALQKYQGKNYQLDSSLFEIRDFTEINTTTSSMALLKEYIHYMEADSGGGPAKNADGTKYIIEDDGAGNPTVGYGVDIFNGGFAPLFETAGYPTYIGGEVDIEFVDALEEQEIQQDIDAIKSATAGLNLKEYQINAMVSRAYNCGIGTLTATNNPGAIGVRNGKNFVQAYNAYWNSETDDLFESKNSNANFNHKLYTEYMSKPVTAKGVYYAGLERRRESEWTLFQTGYYDFLDKWHTEGGEIVEVAAQIHQYMEDNNYTYCVYDCNEYEECHKFGKSHGLNTTFEKSKTGYHNTCCATYVSWVLQEVDYISKSEHTDSATELKNLLLSKGWTRIDNSSDFQPGDILYYSYGHVEIYAGDGKVYNAGSGEAIRGAGPHNRNLSTVTYALRASN